MTPDIEHAYEIAKALRCEEETNDYSDLFMTGIVLYAAEKTGQRSKLSEIKNSLTSTLRDRVDEVRAMRRTDAPGYRTLILICGLFGVDKEESERICSQRRIQIPMNDLLELANQKDLAIG